MRSHKCFTCKKYLGKSFKEFPEGTIDNGKNYFCNISCDFENWLNNWGGMGNNVNCTHEGKLTFYGKGYKQAMRDVSDRIKRDKRLKPFANEGKEEK